MGQKVGLVLSGGGARGAYEVGALRYVAEHHPALLDRVRIITGASVGAVNGVFLASHGLSRDSIAALAELWRSLDLDDVLSLAHGSLFRMVGAASLRLIRQGTKSPATGLLNASALFRLIHRHVDWDALHDSVERGRFEFVAIAATDIATGLTHLFVESTNKEPRPMRDIEVVPTRLELRHVAASAAIPLLFPPVPIAGRWYLDGGLRHNTPLTPALRLGASSLLIVSVDHPRAPLELASREFPGIGQVVGKLLDSMFLDRMAYDLDRLERINDMVEIFERSGASGEALRAELLVRGRRPYRVTPFAAIRPRQDLGRLANEVLLENPGLPGSFRRVVSQLFGNDQHSSADAASFLLFDRNYAEKLLQAGYEDAARCGEQFARL